ncbi:TIGR03915 family putative DNA repair protein [Mucilaginibacter gotjawali]|uniref:Uncharacterized protein n=2 Tax=Mucilaginibacter gotjawali TaxID=1550579 RepID=A0A0X8X0V9_9SPHI|nr:TIGR03915 family putative DNA repair protein [Mucilaginibacter gotjawali]MBB3058407.1 putative DNA metabolism protein [Mucilaginibacter gotjawali]BAU53764.1 hypothetical protein MgSA37_01935 [Mucilaginibacter gotjawali]
MTRLIYDGTFEGLLTAIFEIYAHKLTRVSLQRGENNTSAMFENVIIVKTDEVRAGRVLKGLQKKLSPSGIGRLYIAHLAEIAGDENTLAGFIKYAFDSPVNIEKNFGNKYVQRVSEIVGMMRREKHRMEAFVRFQRLKDDIYYAGIEPDFNVLPLLNRHFKNRYADQKWMIFDSKRKYGLYYDLHDTQFVTIDFSEAHNPANVVSSFNAGEDLYQRLWQNYYHSANIPARKNTPLHLRHIPKRYWKHLTEKF